MIVFATGFDAILGAFDRIDFVGVDGRKLREKWADGPITYLGIQTHGFPNLIMLAGPQAGSGFTNFGRGIEEAVFWTTDLLVRPAGPGRHPHRDHRRGGGGLGASHIRELYDPLLHDAR